MSWEKLRPLEDREIHKGSLSATSACQVAPMSYFIVASLGEAYITKDGQRIYEYRFDLEEEADKTLQDFENMAQLDPDHDWRFVHLSSLHGETFQRQGKNLWVCVESNPGFA